MRPTPLLVACLIAVLHVPAPTARACSPLPSVSLTPVAVADPTGPFVFLCAAGCEHVPDIRWVKSGSAAPVAGAWETLSPPYVGSTPLLVFRSAAPLEAGARYEALADTLPIGTSGGLGFTVGSGALGEPLAEAAVSSAQRSVPSGVSFRCELDRTQALGSCSLPPTELSWTSETRSIPVLSLSLGPRDGFVYRAYPAPHVERINNAFATSVRTTFDFAGASALCVAVDAVDVRSGVLSTRTLCAERTTEEHTLPADAPALGPCRTLPTRDGAPADELRSAWCRERAVFCAASRPPSTCSPPDESVCPAPMDADGGVAAADGDAAGHGASVRPATDTPAEGCSLGASRTPGLDALLVLLGLVRRHTRRRSRQ